MVSMYSPLTSKMNDVIGIKIQVATFFSIYRWKEKQKKGRKRMEGNSVILSYAINVTFIIGIVNNA